MEIVARWRALVASSASLDLASWEREHATLVAATAAILERGGPDRDAVIAAFRAARGVDDELRWALAAVLLPVPGLALEDPEALLDHAEVRPIAGLIRIRPALALTVLRQSDQQVDVENHRSWFAGSPAQIAPVGGGVSVPGVDLAPRRADGRPLTHVLQVDLRAESRNQGADRLAGAGLPDDGILNLFHDLETLGTQGHDDPSAWRVTWRPVPDDDVALVPPRDPALPPAVLLNPQMMLTIEPPADRSQLGGEDAERLARLSALVEAHPYDSNPPFDPVDDLDDLDDFDEAVGDEADPPCPWDDDFVPVEPLSRMGGFGEAGRGGALHAVLRDRLPLEPGDGYVLLLAVNPRAVESELATVTSMEPLEQEARRVLAAPLEVWARARDVARRDVTNVWCFLGDR